MMMSSILEPSAAGPTGKTLCVMYGIAPLRSYHVWNCPHPGFQTFHFNMLIWTWRILKDRLFTQIYCIWRELIALSLSILSYSSYNLPSVLLSVYRFKLCCAVSIFYHIIECTAALTIFTSHLTLCFLHRFQINSIKIIWLYIL